MMKRSTFLTSTLALLAAGACAPGTLERGPTDEGVGELSFALLARDSQGTIYRLRQAAFDVAGYPDVGGDGIGGAGGFSGGGGTGGFFGGGGAAGSLGGAGGGFASGGRPGSSPPPVGFVLSSEVDPNAEALVRKVLPGYYTVALRDGWYLERQTASGVERVEKVVLLSPRNQSSHVWDGGTARVNYQFGVDGTLIDFRNGDLSVEIDVVRPGEPAGTGGYAGYGGGYAGYGGTHGFGGVGGSSR